MKLNSKKFLHLTIKHDLHSHSKQTEEVLLTPKQVTGKIITIPIATVIKSGKVINLLPLLRQIHIKHRQYCLQCLRQTALFRQT